MKHKLIRVIMTTVAAVCLFFTFAGCGQQKPESVKKPVSYPKVVRVVADKETYIETEVNIWNQETERKINCLTVEPKGLSAGEKVPTIVYVHGGTGSAQSLIVEPEKLAADKIAGITFECCGANKTAPKSDGKEIFNSHYTSRISDLEAVFEYVKTLPYVDADQIYFYGQSMGGLVVMMAAPNHNDDIKGIILESTGLSERGGMVAATGNGVVEKYLPVATPEEHIKGYLGDVIISCSQGDSTGAHANGEYTTTIYEERTQGSVTFYSCPEGEHAFNSFSAEGKQITYQAIRDLILG